MLNDPTLQKLLALRLGPMADAWTTQSRDAKTGALSFDERFALLVDAEYLARDNRRLGRLLKDAELRIAGACLEDVDTSTGRGVDRSLLRQLANASWVNEHLNVLVTGALPTHAAALRRARARPRGRHVREAAVANGEGGRAHPR